MPDWLALRLGIAWRLRRNAILAGFGSVAASILLAALGVLREGSPPELSLLMALAASILGAVFSAVAFVLIVILPFLRNLTLPFLICGTTALVAAAALPGDGSLASAGRFLLVIGVLVAIYAMPVPLAFTFRARRHMDVAPARLRAALDIREPGYWDETARIVATDPDDPANLDLRIERRGTRGLSMRLRVLEDTPRRIVTQQWSPSWPRFEVVVTAEVTPDGDGAILDYAERVRRATFMTLAMMWLDRAVEDLVEDIGDILTGCPRRSRRAFELPS